MNYYEVLEIDPISNKDEIRKQYRKLCLKYHPDKNNGNDEQFKKIKEAYEILYNDETRKKYDIQLLFGYIEFTEEDMNILNEYYNKIINSNEFKLLKLLYKSIPNKNDIWNKIKKKREYSIVRAYKSIDICKLLHDEIINLYINITDYKNKILKVIYIFTNNGNYYLFLRDNYPSIIIDNITCTLRINFYIK